MHPGRPGELNGRRGRRVRFEGTHFEDTELKL